MNFRTGIIIGIVLAACAVQGGEPPPPSGSLPAPARLPIDPFERHGLNSGHLQIFPSIEYDLTYTDNSTRATDRRDEDLLQEYTPSVEVRFKPQELIALSFLYEFGWHDYAKDTARDYLSHRSVTEGTVKNLLVEGLSLTFGDNYVQSANTDALQNLLLSFTRYQNNLAYTKLEYHLNRFTIGGKYSYAIIDYFARANRSSDYQSHSAELAGGYAFLPDRLIATASYLFTRTLRTVPGEDFDTHTLLLGVQGAYSKLAFAGGAGYTVAQFIDRDQRDEGPALTAHLAYTPTSRLVASLDASRRFAAAVQTGISTETDLRAAVSFMLTLRGRINVDYTRNDSRRVIGNIDQLSFAYHAAFEYKLARFATATIGYTRSERQVSGAAGDFVINEGRMGIRLAW